MGSRVESGAVTRGTSRRAVVGGLVTTLVAGRLGAVLQFRQLGSQVLDLALAVVGLLAQLGDLAAESTDEFSLLVQVAFQL